MALCPQLPPSSPAPCHPYPSPRSKSPPPAAHFKASRRLPTVKYPLTDITNFTLAQQSTLELPSLAPTAAGDERPLGHTREIYGDAPPRRGRGKNRRGQQRGVRPREVGDIMYSGAVLRSPIPLAASSFHSSLHPAFDFRVTRRKSTPASSVLSNASSHKSSYNKIIAHPRTPRRRPHSFLVASPETPKHARRQTKRWTSSSSRGTALVSPPSPPSPTPTRRQSRFNKSLPGVLSSGHRLPSPPPLCFPIPPSAPVFPCALPHSNSGNHISLLPSMNLVSGLAQGQARKRRTKRDFAEVQWQITMHRSLAWRTTREYLNVEKQNGCQHYTVAKEDSSHKVMDFAQSGLKIAFERPACTCAGGNESQTINRDSQSHWTDSLDRELVKRLWVKLIAQGCRTIPMGSSNPSLVSSQFPTIEHPQRGIPFPSEQPEQPLAPAIQLSSTLRPVSDLQMGSRIPPRQRVSAITSSKSRPHVSPPNTHVSSPKPCIAATISIPSSSSSTLYPIYPDPQPQIPQVSARISRGRLSSAQLTAQAILRHEDARLKPMRRGRPPGLMQKRSSSLRHEVTVEHAG